MTEWNSAAQAGRFVEAYADPILRLCLTYSLSRAAEQEETMTSQTKHKIKKLSGGMVFGIAAAAVMTAGALAAVLSPGLHTWFDTATPGAASALEGGVCRLGLSETYNGWTVTLDECVGDDVSVYIWMDVTAPEGRVLALPEGGYFNTSFDFVFDENHGCGASLIPLSDSDPTDNRMSFLLRNDYWVEGFRGKTVDILIDPLIDCWWTDFGTERAAYHEGSPMTDGIREHRWVFEDVTLDYPDQSIRLKPETEVPCLGGTAILTELEVSPLSVGFTLEGGSCAGYLDHLDRLYPKSFRVPESAGGEGARMGVISPDAQVLAALEEMDASLTVEVTLRDGTKLTPVSVVHEQQGRREDTQVPFLERSRRYDDADSENQWDLPTRVIDPAQVDHVTICGVEIPVSPGT